MQNSAGRHAAKQNTRKITESVCVQRWVQHFNKNTELYYFQRKLLLQTESCTVQSVEVYSQSSLIAILSQMSHVLRDMYCQM